MTIYALCIKCHNEDYCSQECENINEQKLKYHCNNSMKPSCHILNILTNVVQVVKFIYQRK